MSTYFYNGRSSAITGTANIKINGLNNNGIILYIPSSYLFYQEDFEDFKNEKIIDPSGNTIRREDQFNGNIVRQVNITFSGKGYVVVATTSINRDVISDLNQYYDVVPPLDFMHTLSTINDHDWTLYTNGNRSGKYIKKILVDNSVVRIKMIDFCYHDGNITYYQPRFFIEY